jgi:hypothetical protein
MKATVRALITAAAVALAALFLPACSTTAGAPAAPKADALTVQKEIAVARINAEGVRAAGLLKLVEKTDSEFAKGLVAGLIATGGNSAASAPVSINVPPERDWLDRALQVGHFLLNPLDMVLDYRREKRAQQHAAEKYKYTLDALGAAQSEGYSFASDVLDRTTPAAEPVAEPAAE